MSEETEVEEQEQEEQSFEDAFEELSTKQESNDLPEGYELDDAGDEPEDETEQTAEQAVEPEEPKDVWAGASDEQRKAFNEAKSEASNWAHKYKSDEGRVSALQRQINELAQAKEESEAKTVQPPSGDKWREIDEDYPEIAGGINERIEAERARHQADLNAMREQFNSMLNPIVEQQKQRETQAELDALASQHPDWQDVAQSQEFTGWLNEQPASVQSLYGSNSAKDAGYLIKTYKSDKGIAAKAARPELNPAVQAKREKQLQESTGISGRKTSARAIPKDDFDGSFDYYARQHEARRSSR